MRLWTDPEIRKKALRAFVASQGRMPTREELGAFYRAIASRIPKELKGKKVPKKAARSYFSKLLSKNLGGNR